MSRRARALEAMRACFVSVTGEGAHRFLWVKIKLSRADGDLMASIGHELRHTIEVLDAPRVTSSGKMFMFYRHEGFIGSSGAFETAAAVKAGDAVHTGTFRRARRNRLFAGT